MLFLWALNFCENGKKRYSQMLLKFKILQQFTFTNWTFCQIILPANLFYRIEICLPFVLLYPRLKNKIMQQNMTKCGVFSNVILA